MNKEISNNQNIVLTKETVFWKISIILLGSIGLSTGLFKLSEFWTSYVLDIVGPAWIYILIRGQYQSKNATFLSLKFSPELAFALIAGICFIIEIMQFFNLYNSTFDPYDFLSYFSGIFIIYLIDKWFIKRENIRIKKSSR